MRSFGEDAHCPTPLAQPAGQHLAVVPYAAYQRGIVGGNDE